MAKDEKQSTGPGGDNLSSVSSQYRTAAGLPPRESDAPTDLSEAAHEKRYEPEGGYGGKDGITNTASTNSSEELRVSQRAEQAEQRAEQLEETGLTGGETATQEAIVTGEEVVDVKPAPGYTPEAEVVAGDSDEDKA